MADNNGVRARTRREFLGSAAAGLAGSFAGIPLLNAATTPAAKGDIPYRSLGQTGEKVSLLGMGGWQLGRMPDEGFSTRFVRTAIDSGINYLEAAWDYHAGLSEYRLGKALLDGWRKKIFLATKINGRRKDIANWQLEESLRRLRTDVIDLAIFHEVLHPEEPEIILGPGGALEAFLEARKAGKIRYIGFSGHYDPSVHIKLLDLAEKQGFRFDVGMIALNVMDPHYKSFAKTVLPRLAAHGTGVLGFKTMGGGAFVGPERVLEGIQVTPADCLRYVMSLPTSVVISGMDTFEILERNVQVARGFTPMSEEEVSSLLARTAESGRTGKFEWFKGQEGLRRTKELHGTYF